MKFGAFDPMNRSKTIPADFHAFWIAGPERPKVARRVLPLRAGGGSSLVPARSATTVFCAFSPGGRTMTHSFTKLLASTALAATATGLAPAAWAQGTASQATNPQATTSNGIAEIIVTANRREESAQSVPVAVTAVSGEQLRELGIGSAADLTGKVPSLFISSGGNQRNVEVVVIRGQGQTYLSPVGVVNYFNDVPLIQGSITAIQGAPGMFFDLQSMQVLRGPQGTLFGKNTTGGAVLLGPKRPTDKLEGYAQFQLGNYQDREFEGAINIPVIADKLAVRASFKKVDRDGYTKDVGPQAYSKAGGFAFNSVCAPPNGAPAGSCVASNGFAGKDYDNRHYWHARIGVLFTPTDTIENYLVGYYAKAHDNGTGFIFDGYRGAAVGNPYDFSVPTIAGALTYNANNPTTPVSFANIGQFIGTGNAVVQQIIDRQNALGPRQTALNSDTFERTKSWGLVNTLSIDLNDAIKLKSITGYQSLKQNYTWDLDGSILPILSQNMGYTNAAASAAAPASLVGKPGDALNVTNTSLFSQELQLQGSALDRNIEWVVGGFYSKQKPEGLQGGASFNAGSYNPGTFYAITTQAKAVFAQGSVNFGAFSEALDGLKFTAGLRRTWDKLNSSRFSGNFVLNPLVLDNKLSSAATTWTVGLDYQASKDLLVYGKVTRGYKAGNFVYSDPGLATINGKPEYVTSYELGFKSDFTLGTVPVRFNANVFNLDYKDIQRAAANNVNNGCLSASPPARCALVGNTTGLDQGAIVFNAEKARVRGVELELVVRPVKGLQLSSSYSYIDAKYKKYTQNISGDSLNTTVDTCNGPKALIYGVPQAFDFSCLPFQNTPKNIFNVNARYEIPAGDEVGTFVVGANYSWVDKVYTSATTTPNDDPKSMLAAYGLLNLSAEWNGILGSPLDLRVFATNVTNKLYRTYSYVGVKQASGFSNSLYGEPRMYGASLRFRFGGE